MSEGNSGGGSKAIVEMIVILVLVGFGLWWMKNPPEKTAVNNLPVSAPDGTTGSGNTSGSRATISYQNALVQFKDKRIQLDSTCQASPKSVTYKNGTNIMIDNRSAETRTVKVGSTFTIQPWGFKIVNISSASLPSTWYVDCGNSQNVATILIQK